MPSSQNCCWPNFAFQSPGIRSISCLGVTSTTFCNRSQKFSFSLLLPYLSGHTSAWMTVVLIKRDWKRAVIMRSFIGLQLLKHGATSLDMIIATPLWCALSSLLEYMMASSFCVFSRPKPDSQHPETPKITMPNDPSHLLSELSY